MGKGCEGNAVKQPLHYIFIADCSGSMRGAGKIQALNAAIRNAVPHMQRVAKDNHYAEVLVRCIKFSKGAEWYISEPTPVHQFTWTDLKADGVTDLGKALIMVAKQMEEPPMPNKALTPVLVLISDGQPTDDFEGGLKALMEQPFGKKAVRIAVAIGNDANHEVLQKFIGNPDLKPLLAENPESLTENIKWVMTAVLQVAAAIDIEDPRQTLPLALPPPPTHEGAKVW